MSSIAPGPKLPILGQPAEADPGAADGRRWWRTLEEQAQRRLPTPEFEEGAAEAPDGFSRRGFRPRDIDRQKYGVPAEDYAQDKAKAVFRNGVLTVTIPPKEPEGGGVKIEIVKEGN